MKNLRTTIEYDLDSNTSVVYLDGNSICQLEFNTDKFTSFCNLTEDETDYYYFLMIDDRDEQDYDVREEQGLYTYGY